MARIDPPPVTAQVACDSCGRTAPVATKQSNLPQGWATVAITVSLNVVGSSPATRTNTPKELCPDCIGTIQKFLDPKVAK